MKAYKYRLYPTVEQQRLMNQHFGCARHVYNWGLAEKKKHYEETGQGLSKRELQNQLVASKKEEKPWLKEVNSQSLLAVLLHLEKAFFAFFKGRAKFPKFKKKYAGHQSFECPQHVKVNFEQSLLDLPKMPGVKTKFHRCFEGKIKTVTISKTPTGKYFASILVEDGVREPTPVVIEPTLTVGLDLGLAHFLTDSEGVQLENPSHLKRALERLSQVQKRFSRCRKDSNNRAKQKKRIARVHERVANRRHDFIHEVTAELAVKNQATSFAVEDLNIKGMVKNRKLSRAIQDVGWGMFLSALAYKCQWQGKNLLKIGRFVPSSKICNGCLSQVKALPLSIRSWVCPCCKRRHCRDKNAAQNIREFALADALGYSVCVKSSPVMIPISVGMAARDTDFCQYGSQEAPTITAYAV
jgi:putative transposase